MFSVTFNLLLLCGVNRSIKPTYGLAVFALTGMIFAFLASSSRSGCPNLRHIIAIVFLVERLDMLDVLGF